jgi:hypothetical protein
MHVQVLEKHGLCVAFSEVLDAGMTHDMSQAMNYHRVIESFFNQVTVVPFRFGTLLDDRVDLERLLTDRAEHYRETLEALEGNVEMGIRAIMDANEIPRGKSRPLRAVPSFDRPDAGKQYLLNRTAYYQTEASLAREKEQVAQKFRIALAGMFRGFRSEASWSGPERQELGTILVSLYFLVPKKLVSLFRKAFSSLAAKESSKLLLSGPWPPYNFVLPDDSRASQHQSPFKPDRYRVEY